MPAGPSMRASSLPHTCHAVPLPQACLPPHSPSPSLPSHRFCNIKLVFREWQVAAAGAGPRPRGRLADLMGMLQGLRLTHVGHHHSGRDDVINIGNIACELARRGARLRTTGAFADGQFVRVAS
jgi:hypothetical protein